MQLDFTNVQFTPLAFKIIPAIGVFLTNHPKSQIKLDKDIALRPIKMQHLNLPNLTWALNFLIFLKSN
ncbi:MAG: hypothetical protein RLZZ241_1987 [Bacteroidota bacterium]|jgi:hypothetical protein